MTTRREKIIYFSLALCLFLLFRHLLGPLIGLTGMMLTMASYVFAVLLATAYLYKALLHPSKKHDQEAAE